MFDALNSSEIRRIIFKLKHPAGQIIGLARMVAASAQTEGLIDDVPEFVYSNPSVDALAERILAAYWELVLEGVYTPGGRVHQTDFASFCVTEHGRKCFEAGELAPHDPDDYMKRLKSMCPVIDLSTLVYVEEALCTFKARRFLSAVVMIGVAAESMWIRLGESVKNALDTPAKQQAFEKETKSGKIKRLHDEVIKRLKQQPSTPLPGELDALIAQHLHGIADLTRQTRNAAGHPTGKRIERDEAFALLLLFPTYCQTVSKLMQWLSQNRI